MAQSDRIGVGQYAWNFIGFVLSNVSKDTAGQFTKHILILNQELTLYSEGFNFSPKIVKVFFSIRQEQTLIIKS